MLLDIIDADLMYCCLGVVRLLHLKVLLSIPFIIFVSFPLWNDRLVRVFSLNLNDFNAFCFDDGIVDVLQRLIVLRCGLYVLFTVSYCVRRMVSHLFWVLRYDDSLDFIFVIGCHQLYFFSIMISKTLIHDFLDDDLEGFFCGRWRSGELFELISVLVFKLNWFDVCIL